MEVEVLAHKLEPLVPEKVARWLKLRDLGDTDVRAAVDHEIVRVAHRILGDFRKKILLSLPPKTKSQGSIHLGKIIYEKEKWDFGISENELLRNMAVFGMSGSGKTNVAFHIFLQLVNSNVPCLFWDWKRTARHLIPQLRTKIKVYTPGRDLAPFPFNPFIVPPGLEPRVYVNQIVDVMAEAYTLGDGSRRVLQKAITECYEKTSAPTVSELIEAVERIPSTDRVRGWKISALRALESLAFASVMGKDSKAQEQLAKTLLKENTVIELDALAHGAKKFLMPMMCLWIYYVQLGKESREKLQLVVFIEEAHHILYRQEQRSKETVMNMLLRQCREIGIGTIVIDQHPHLISSAAIGNAYTTLCMNLREPTDVNKAAGLSLVGDDAKHVFSSLPVGQAIVKLQDKWRAPFLIEIPLVQVKKGLVTDGVLKEFVKGTLSKKELQDLGDVFGSVREDSEQLSILDEDELKLVEDVLLNYGSSVRERYKRVGLSVDRGNKAKKKLVQRGILEESDVKVGRQLTKMLKIDGAVMGKYGFKNRFGHGSVVHEYWKRMCANHFQQQGYSVMEECPRNIGAVDIEVSNKTERFGVEIETGKSDAVWNVKQDILSGLKKVLVVAVNEDALSKVERALGREGLIIPGRVELILAEKLLGR